MSGLTSWEPISIPNELRAVGPTLIFAAAFCLVGAWLELAGVLAGRHLRGVPAMVMGPSPIKSLLKTFQANQGRLTEPKGKARSVVRNRTHGVAV